MADAWGSIPACAGEARWHCPGPVSVTVYPRVCGGSETNKRPEPSPAGLSPRVRGKLHQRRTVWANQRSIPACAGEAPGPGKAPLRCGVYPRVCGGSGVIILAQLRRHGLSPRVRGKQWLRNSGGGSGGSIPACAGEASTRLSAPAGYPVYPRVCGGSARRSGRLLAYHGLSPRVRGKHMVADCRCRPGRSIPACAGEARGVSSASANLRVYPRVCGGSRRMCRTKASMNGLSPRVRGKLPRKSLGQRRMGSIPACAGEASWGCARASASRVYPRVCGGSSRSSSTAASAAGLSPRVRGKPPPAGYRQPDQRSIPACAGEAPAIGPLTTAVRVYPRVCGGSALAKGGVIGVAGLSPRVRGKHHALSQSGVWRRSIPACAGEALSDANFAVRGAVYPRVCGGSDMRARYYLAQNGLSPRVRGKRAISTTAPGHWGSIPACAGEARYTTRSTAVNRVYPRVCGGSGPSR